MIEIACGRRRHHAPLTCTFHVGPPPRAMRDLAMVVVEGVDAGLEMARPGRTAEEVEAAWQAVLRRNGLSKDSRAHCSIGLAYPPDWDERTVSLRPGDRTEIADAMAEQTPSLPVAMPMSGMAPRPRSCWPG